MFAQRACGCPVEPWRYPFKCEAHAAQDGRVRLPDVRRDDWYRANTCPFCGRVNPAGLACASANVCGMCGVISCAEHRMSTYRLGVICPLEVRPRTRVGRALLRALAAIGSEARA